MVVITVPDCPPSISLCFGLLHLSVFRLTAAMTSHATVLIEAFGMEEAMEISSLAPQAPGATGDACRVLVGPSKGRFLV